MNPLFLVVALVPLLLILAPRMVSATTSHKLPECTDNFIGSCRDSGDISSPPQKTQICNGIVVPFGAGHCAVTISAAYKSGFSHGISDGKLASHGNVNWYILQPGKGFSFHTQDFINGYKNGFCKVNPLGGSDGDNSGDSSFSCN